MIRFLGIGMLLLFSLSPHAQIELIRQSFEEAPLDTILQQLNEQYGLKYAYQSRSIDHIKTDWTYRGNSLNEALVSLFEPLNLEYKIVRDDLILVREKNNRQVKASFPFQLSGKVVDGHTGEVLAFANIHLPGDEIVYADENGRFQLEFSHDSTISELLFTYLSYSQSKRIVPSNQKLQLTVKLYPFSQQLDPIKVYARHRVLSRQAGRQDVLLVEPSFGFSTQGFDDPLSALQSLPGIANFTESGGLLNIRGGDDFDNYVLIDGIPLYKVDHFFGYFSSLSQEIVQDISIYKNAFPAEYGGKSSGVIDIRSKEVLGDWQGSASIGLLYTSAALEFPISDKLQAFAGIRFNNSNLANHTFSNLTEEQSGPKRLFLQRHPKIRFESEHNPSFSFYDAYAKLNYEVSPSTSLLINFFHGADRFKNELLSNYTWEGSNVRFRLTESYVDDNQWMNTGSSVQLSHQWSSRFNSDLSLAYSAHQSSTDVGYTIEKISSEVVRDDLSQESLNRLEGFFIQQDNSYQLSREHRLNFGLQVSREKADASIQTFKENILERSQQGSVWSAYYEYKGQIGQLSLTAGMRHNYYETQDQLYHSPRLFMKYDFTKGFYAKASWSIYQQFIRQLYHESPTGRTHYLWVMANGGPIPVLERQHFMLGMGGYWKDLSIDVELYDIRSSGELEHALSIIGFNPINGRPQGGSMPLIFQGIGRTLGADLFIRWHGEQWQPFLSYTLSKSTVSFDEIQEGNPILAQNDRRHQLSAGLNYSIDQWDFQVAYHYASGRPYTDLSRYKNDPRDRRTQLSLREERLPSYQRCDISAAYTFDLESSQIQLKGSIFNLLNRDNVKYYQYMYSIRQPEDSENIVLGFDQNMLGFLPNLSVNWKF